MPATPTPIEQAFLDDIVAHPDDPSLWLILADWLEDRADPRAELVRLTWQLQYEADHADFQRRQARVQELLRAGVGPLRPGRVLGGIEFRWIAPGTFLMGSPPEESQRKDHEPQHRVTLTAPFWLGVYPVTQGQWLSIAGTNPSNFTRTGSRGSRVAHVSEADLLNFPVDTISWNLATAFCHTASERLGCPIMLPTEAQWEYACRAGTTTPYHFGHALNGTLANCNGDHPWGTEVTGPNLERPTTVGDPAYPPNAWGLHDMHGTIWNWCRDAYHRGSARPQRDPVHEDATARQYALRGGSWFSQAHMCRAAYRHHVERSCGAPGLGIRLVCLA